MFVSMFYMLCCKFMFYKRLLSSSPTKFWEARILCGLFLCPKQSKINNLANYRLLSALIGYCTSLQKSG